MMEEFKEKVAENAELVKKFIEEKKAREQQKKEEHKKKMAQMQLDAEAVKA